MPNNRLLINQVGESLQLAWQRGAASPRMADPVPFEHPFDAAVLDELRWYLEEYLSFPYGLAPDRAAGIEQQFEVWGQALFEQVFQGTDEGREFFQEATRAGLDTCEIGITSDNPQVLNLPWELLYSPKDLFLAPKLAGMYRSLSSHKVRAELPQLPQDQLNILLVIARPYEQDVGFQTIARPMLEALRPLGAMVNLKVLRPPSFATFEQELNAHREGFYHIVHFDGHGSFDPNAGRQFNLMDASGQGELVFETLEGKEDVVSADRIAQSLTDCRVPVFVLNACKSAQEGGEKFSSVATRFISSGAKGVVAMAYSVYADAAKHFMARFYGELVQGAGLSQAVAAARLSVLNNAERQSPRGERTLQDWLVPVLYQQEAYTPFVPQNPTPSFAELMAQVAQDDTEPQAVNLPAAGTYGFVGRSAEILQLERAFRQNPVVLLKGMGGVGKTQLALGFGRWLADTQGREGGIFFTSFEQGATLSNVINEIGRQLGGAQFSQLMAEQQEAAVLQYLQTHPCLLIWDNFEPVAGFAGNPPLLTGPERQRLQDWLKALRDGQSWVLITSRREEPWLDCGYRLLPLRGLSMPHRRFPGLSGSEELAAKILQTVGVERGALSEDYLELLRLLGGHPLSLRVVLPHLRQQSPTALIEALRQGLDTFGGAEEEGRERSLTVSLDYSFAALSERVRRHLPFLAFFSERVVVDWLDLFTRDPENEFGQAYRAVFGENPQKDDWLGILQEAAAASIVEPFDPTIVQIHPALPWYLRQRLGEQYSAIVELEKKLLSFYGSLADHYRQQLISNAELASFVLRFEEPNFLQQLRLAEQQQDWSNAQFLIQALGELYERIGRKPAFRTLRERGLAQIGIPLAEAKAKGKDAFNFWMYLRGADANELLQAANLDGGAAIFQEILTELIALNDDSMRLKIASIQHNLGYVFQEQRRFDDAIANFQKALKIYEDAGDQYQAADEYHHLGMVAQEQRRFDDAIANFQKALKIKEDAGDQYSAATDYHHLGMVAQEQRRFDDAIANFQKALKIKEDAGDQYSAATDYHHLGMVAQEQRRFDDAIANFQKALKIREDVGDLYMAATDYHHLGIVAQEQRRFDDAIANFQKALKIKEDAGDQYRAASEYHHLGIVAQEQRRFDDAIANFQKALKIYEDAGDQYRAASEYHQLGIVAQEQRRFDDAIANFQKALKIYEDVGDQYQAADEYHHLGIVAQEQRRFDDAIAYYKKALKIYEDAGDQYSAAREYHQLGMVAQEQRRFDDALPYFVKALQIYIESEDTYTAGYPLQQLAQLLQQLGATSFKSLWQDSTGTDCPDELFAILQQTAEEAG